MNNNYFRITIYNKKDNLSVIFDSNGYFKTLDDFSADLRSRGSDILAATTDETFLDGNIAKAEYDTEAIHCRAHHTGEPIKTTHELNGVTYHALQVNEKIYIPDRAKVLSHGQYDKVASETSTVSTAAAAIINKPAVAAKSSIGAGGIYQKYMKVKTENPGAIIFYRIGDFYEVLGDDASTASAMLGLTLTGRDFGLDERVPMCGVPYNTVDGHIAKLVDWGFKVAVAE